MNLGEKLAREYLAGQGLKFVAANYLMRIGEIDLIMEDGKYLVFIEVKFRTSERWGTALEQVTAAKMQKIRRVAEAFLQNYDRFPGEVPYVRFDVIGISPAGAGYRFNWVKGAFE